MKSCRAWAPLGADRLYHLVRGGYYDGLVIGLNQQVKSFAIPALTTSFTKNVLNTYEPWRVDYAGAGL